MSVAVTRGRTATSVAARRAPGEGRSLAGGGWVCHARVAEAPAGAAAVMMDRSFPHFS